MTVISNCGFNNVWDFFFFFEKDYLNPSIIDPEAARPCHHHLSIIDPLKVRPRHHPRINELLIHRTTGPSTPPKTFPIGAHWARGVVMSHFLADWHYVTFCSVFLFLFFIIIIFKVTLSPMALCFRGYFYFNGIISRFHFHDFFFQVLFIRPFPLPNLMPLLHFFFFPNPQPTF